MPVQGPIVVATDFSEGADRALRQGYTIAQHLGTKLVVCHVLPEAFNVRVLFPHTAGIDHETQRTLEKKATEVLHERVAALGPHAADAVAIDIESGTPHAGILAVADRARARLIVLGPGPTARRVARSFGAPVLVARPSPVDGAVLGATDFSDPSLPALHMAADEARRRQAQLRLLHCVDVDATAYLPPAVMPGMMHMSPVPASMITQLDVDARDRLREAAKTIGADAELVVAHRPPARGIVESAAAIATALIVVGTHGRSGLARLSFGSVAEDVITHAECSVLVVPLHSE